ncbi:sigma-70 family RNA polymerase sigma factor [Tepidiforma sp.]|uniref:sigma-70 family RNA polymerase sigma factor n=1 Tax=Tepidiforma sp. TaxID=2682230 RepID=UPI002613BA7B|nr:sigma-70 family RNA polymerase sigma factor [Tepidiforma sp.]
MYREEDYRAIDAHLGFFPGCAIRPPLRMDTTCTPGGTGRVSPYACDVIYGDLLPSPSPEDPEETALRKGLRVAVAQALAALDSRERQVLRLRFGFAGEPQTLEQIGAVFGLTRERIRQIEAKALKKLQSPRFMPFLEPWRPGGPARPAAKPAAPAVLRRVGAPAPRDGSADRRHVGPAKTNRETDRRAAPAPPLANRPPASAERPPAAPAPADPSSPAPATAEDAIYDAIVHVFFPPSGPSDAESAASSSVPAVTGTSDATERLLAMLEPAERAALEHLHGFRAALAPAAIERQLGIPQARLTDLDRWFTRELRRHRAAPGTYDPAPPPPSAPEEPAETEDPGSRLILFPAVAPQDPLAMALEGFRARGYDIVDNRPRGGALWVHDLHMKLAQEMEDLSRRGIRFRFTEHKRAGTWGWYLEEAPAPAAQRPPRQLALPSPSRKPRKARKYRVPS